MNTSYYAKAGSDPNAVAISQGVPKWYTGRVYKKLAPPWWIIKLEDPERYVKEYRKLLSKLNPHEVYAELGPNAILLCYEKPGEFCHRRLVAEWLNEHLGIEIPELGDSPKPLTPHISQSMLF